MPNDIEFPGAEPRYVFERDCLAFLAHVDGKPIECLISAELLMARFGAQEVTELALRQAYREHRAEIEAIARSHLENGWIDEEGRVSLTTRFTRPNVTFTPRAVASPAVILAHRVLTQIIGPNAEAIDITWDVGGNASPPASISLQLVDPSSGHEGKLYMRPRIDDDPDNLRIILAEVWARVLRARSQKLILRSG